MEMRKGMGLVGVCSKSLILMGTEKSVLGIGFKNENIHGSTIGTVSPF